MDPLIVAVFVVVFGLVALTLFLAERHFREQKKKKVVEMLGDSTRSAARAKTKLLIDRTAGSNVFVTRLLERLNLFHKLEATVQQSGLKLTTNALVIQMVMLFGVAALLATRLDLGVSPQIAAPAIGLAAGSLPYLFVRRKRTKRLNQFEEQLPDALDFLSRAMRSGHAFSISLEMLSEESAAPLGTEFKKVFSEHNLGLPIETALTNLTARVPMIDVQFFVSAVLLQRETGGNLAEILTKLAVIIRERFKLKGQVRAASAHGRITGTILTIMPVVLTLGLLLIAPGYLQGMAKDPDGKWLVVGAVCGIITGHFCIRKIVKIKV